MTSQEWVPQANCITYLSFPPCMVPAEVPTLAGPFTVLEGLPYILLDSVFTLFT